MTIGEYVAFNYKKGSLIYSPCFGYIKYDNYKVTENGHYYIKCVDKNHHVKWFTEDGKYRDGKQPNTQECMLFPSFENRVWLTN